MKPRSLRLATDVHTAKAPAIPTAGRAKVRVRQTILSMTHIQEDRMRIQAMPEVAEAMYHLISVMTGALLYVRNAKGLDP